MRAPASIVVVLLALLAAPALAQESRFQSDLRREGEDLKESCSGFNPKALVGCIVTVATEDPFHVAIGSLPPLNGMGFGLAFAEHYTPNEQWRISWNADSVFATSGSWRAGAYEKLIHIPDDGGIIKVVRPERHPRRVYRRSPSPSIPFSTSTRRRSRSTRSRRTPARIRTASGKPSSARTRFTRSAEWPRFVLFDCR
jgi:hypothetical protein